MTAMEFFCTGDFGCATWPIAAGVTIVLALVFAAGH